MFKSIHRFTQLCIFTILWLILWRIKILIWNIQLSLIFIPDRCQLRFIINKIRNIFQFLSCLR